MNIGAKRDLRSQTCCFIGHQEIPPGEERKILMRVQHRLLPLIFSSDTNLQFFGLTGEPGFSQLVADFIIRQQKHQKRLKMILVLPYYGYEDTFSSDAKAHFVQIQKAASKIVYVAPSPEKNSVELCYRHLVDGSEYCCFYCTKPAGNVSDVVRYANQKGKTLWNASSFDLGQLMQRQN